VWVAALRDGTAYGSVQVQPPVAADPVDPELLAVLEPVNDPVKVADAEPVKDLELGAKPELLESAEVGNPPKPTPTYWTRRLKLGS